MMQQRKRGSSNPELWVVGTRLIMGVIFIFALSFTVDFDEHAIAQGDQKDTPELNVFNLYDKPIGAVDMEGKVYNPYGKPVGYIDAAGTVHNIYDKPIGKIDRDGKAFNLLGTFLGSVDTDGNVFNINGRKLGSVRPPEPGNIIQIGGAAWLLLIRRR